MASEEEVIGEGGEAALDPSPLGFPNSRRPSSQTDVGFEKSISESELASSEAQIDDGSIKARGSTLRRGSEDDLGSGRRKVSNSGSILKSRESIKDGKPSRRQWGSGRMPKGLDGVDLDNPEVKELLRRLSKIEASSSSSSGHAKMASSSPCLQRGGIKVGSQNILIIFNA